jgi:hypothetical protein
MRKGGLHPTEVKVNLPQEDACGRHSGDLA